MGKPEKGVSRRTVLAGIAACGAAAALPKVLAAPAFIKNLKKKPNILFLITDQERGWEDMPSNIDLPAHDWMLERGVGITNHYANTTPCSPSRSVIYSGQQTMHTGMTANLSAPPYPKLNNIKTLGDYLTEAGYYPAYKGKWHLTEINDTTSLNYGPYPMKTRALEKWGFHDFNFQGDLHGIVWTGFQNDATTATEAVNWLKNKGRDMDQPWSLFVNFVNPHDVMFYLASELQQKTRIDPTFMAPFKKAPLTPIYQKDWTDHPLPESFYKDNLETKPWAQRGYAEILNYIYGHIELDNELAWRQYQSYYFNCIRNASRQARWVIDAVAKMGMLDDTIIVYTSDHGEMLGAHTLRQKGPCAYKENSRVPLIIKHPDVSGSAVTPALSSCVDITPTILGLAGVDMGTFKENNPQVVGLDLSSLVEKPYVPTQRDKQGILFAYGVPMYVDPDLTKKMLGRRKGSDPLAMIVASLEMGQLGPSLSNRGLHRGIFDGRYKFLRYFGMGYHNTPETWDELLALNDLELYDLQTDPNEITNLAYHPEKYKSLIMRLNQQTNALIKAEIGVDNGAEFPGPAFLYNA